MSVSVRLSTELPACLSACLPLLRMCVFVSDAVFNILLKNKQKIYTAYMSLCVCARTLLHAPSTGFLMPQFMHTIQHTARTPSLSLSLIIVTVNASVIADDGEVDCSEPSTPLIHFCCYRLAVATDFLDRFPSISLCLPTLLNDFDDLSI